MGKFVGHWVELVDGVMITLGHTAIRIGSCTSPIKELIDNP